jgi:hypothetical protein
MDFLCYLYTKVIITLKDAYMMKQGSMRGRFPDRFHSPNLFLFSHRLRHHLRNHRRK